MSERGYIALARGILDHPVVGARKPYTRHDAWEWLLLEAAWKPRRCDAGGIVVELKRGQLVHSTRYIAKAWGWPETNVRRFLTRLKTGAMIGATTGAGITVLTVCNYEIYQTPHNESGALSGAATGAKVAQQRRRKEEGNKERKENTRLRAGEPEGFAEWYEAYPKKKKPKDAARAYRKIVPKEISHADLMARTVAFAASWKARPAEEIKFCPYPASWLNSGEYLDELPELPPNNSGSQPNGIKIEAPTRDPATFKDQEWTERLEMHRGGVAWPEMYWGPPPGKPGCLVPAKLIVSVLSGREGQPQSPTQEATSK
jgi:hypothetical protein